MRVGYFCIIPTLWLKKPVITGYFASTIVPDNGGYILYIEDEPLMFFSSVDEIEMVGLSYEGEKNEENLY